MSKHDDPNNPDPGGDPLGGGPGSPPAPSASDEAPSTNTELQEWRRRALEAEALVDRLNAEIESLRAQLESNSRTHEVNALLERAGAIDLDAARAVLDARLANAPDESRDIGATVEVLKVALPFLFAKPTPAEEPPAPIPMARTRSAMSAAPDPASRAFDDLDALLTVVKDNTRAVTALEAAVARFTPSSPSQPVAPRAA